MRRAFILSSSRARKKKLNTSFFEHPSRTSFWISKPDFFVKIFLFWTDFLLNIKWHFLNIHPNRTFLWTSKFPYLKKRLLCFRSGSRTSLWKTRAMKPRLNHKMNEQSEDEPSELPIITSPDIYIYVCVCVAADFYSGRFCRSRTLWLKSQHSNQHVSNWLINDLSDFYGNSFIIRLTLGRHHYRKNW